MSKRLVALKKIELEGTSDLRKEEYYSVAGVKVTVKKVKKLDLRQFEIDVENDWIDDAEFWCTCKSCSIKGIPNNNADCVFIKSLKAYLKLKKHEI